MTYLFGVLWRQQNINIANIFRGTGSLSICLLLNAWPHDIVLNMRHWGLIWILANIYVFFYPTFWTHIFDSNDVFSQHMNVKIENTQKLCKKLMKVLNFSGLAEAGHVRCPGRGGVREPKSHEILMPLCFQRDVNNDALFISF